MLCHVFFASPYFDHDAFMHHALHILDAPDDNNNRKIKNYKIYIAL